jgi:hypothetical protein
MVHAAGRRLRAGGQDPHLVRTSAPPSPRSTRLWHPTEQLLKGLKTSEYSTCPIETFRAGRYLPNMDACACLPHGPHKLSHLCSVPEIFPRFRKARFVPTQPGNWALANRPGAEGACCRGSGGRLFARTRDHRSIVGDLFENEPGNSGFVAAVRFWPKPLEVREAQGSPFSPRKPSASGISAQVGGCRQAGKMTPSLSLLGIRESDRQSRRTRVDAIEDRS